MPCAAPLPAGDSAAAVGATLSGLTPGSAYYFRVVAVDAGGASYGSPQQLRTAPEPPRSGVLGEQTLPPPILAVRGNLRRLSGGILVRFPGASGFVRVVTLEQVPFGATIDASGGRVELTVEGSRHAIETFTIYGGEFQLAQSRAGLVTAKLVGGSFSGCAAATAAPGRRTARAARRQPAKHVVRKLWVEGHGHFATHGSYATAAVLGTRWLTEDLCEGTYVYVATDRVLVTNLRTHHREVVLAGHSYLVPR